jgi:hypothetical protein
VHACTVRVTVGLAAVAAGDGAAACGAPLQVMNAFSTAVGDTLPNVPDLIQHRMARRTISNEGPAGPAAEFVDPGIQVWWW